MFFKRKKRKKQKFKKEKPLISKKQHERIVNLLINKKRLMVFVE